MKNALLVCGLMLSTAGITAQGKEKAKSLHDQFTGQEYGLAGCGLGSVLLGDKPGIIQIFAVSTNGIAGNQTFGISSGTLNCDDDSSANSAALEAKISNLVLANRNRIETEAVQGEGETIAALAALGNCAAEVELGRNMQRQFGEIFPEQADYRTITANLLPVMKNSNCKI